MREEDRVLAFICVYIPRRVFQRVGLLDARFTGYGHEDNDYCLRVQNARKKLRIYDGCIVEHGVVRSTFRSKPNIDALSDEGKRKFIEKWGHSP